MRAGTVCAYTHCSCASHNRRSGDLHLNNDQLRWSGRRDSNPRPPPWQNGWRRYHDLRFSGDHGVNLRIHVAVRCGRSASFSPALCPQCVLPAVCRATNALGGTAQLLRARAPVVRPGRGLRPDTLLALPPSSFSSASRSIRKCATGNRASRGRGSSSPSCWTPSRRVCRPPTSSTITRRSPKRTCEQRQPTAPDRQGEGLRAAVRLVKIKLDKNVAAKDLLLSLDHDTESVPRRSPPARAGGIRTPDLLIRSRLRSIHAHPWDAAPWDLCLGLSCLVRSSPCRWVPEWVP
jgi:hypothetical protein